MQITLNGTLTEIDAPQEMPLLWALRDVLGLTGTKFGCGLGLCGACTVLHGDEAVRSCQLALGDVTLPITTIESPELAPLQAAWEAEQVAQCGYCQSGQILSAAALLRAVPTPTEAQIDDAMQGNLCRCGTYPRIRRAIQRAAT